MIHVVLMPYRSTTPARTPPTLPLTNRLNVLAPHPLVPPRHPRPSHRTHSRQVRPSTLSTLAPQPPRPLPHKPPQRPHFPAPRTPPLQRPRIHTQKFYGAEEPDGQQGTF